MFSANAVVLLWVVVVVSAVLLIALLWWALSDLFLATIELPFSETLARWRQRVGNSDETPTPNAEA